MKHQASESASSPSCSEAMSRLIDGELDGGGCREVVDRLGRDEGARQDWVLLNIACDAVRSSETAALHSGGFVSRFSARLATEPVVLAPNRIRSRAVFRRVVIPSAAVAAAAAVLVIVAVPQLRAPDPVETARISAPKVQQVVPVKAEDVERSKVFEAYLEAHRDSGASPVSRGNENVIPAALTSDPR